MRKVLLVLMMLFFVSPANAMICLDNTDTLEGGASVDAVIDYTVHGLVGTSFTNIAEGQLSNTDPSVLYTAGAGISIVSVTYVNTHSSAVTVNLYLDPANAGTPRRMIPKNLSLGIGYSMHFDGARCTIIDASGNIVTSYGTHATKHTDGTDDIRDATNALKGLATAAHITAIEANTGKTTNATHTGEVTGSVGLVLDPTCISGKVDTTIVDADYVLFWDATDSTLKKVDAAELTAGGGAAWRFINLPAGSWDYPASNPAPLDTDTFTNGTQKRHLFDDTTEEFVIADIIMPSDLDASGTVSFICYGYAVTWVTGKNIELKLYHSAKTNNEQLDAAYASKESGDKALNTSAQDVLDVLTFTETVANLGWAAGDKIRIKLSRIIASANDLTGDFGLTNFQIKIPRS